MNMVDLLVVAAIILFAWAGWRQGFVAALTSFVGFIGGGLLGSFIAPFVLESFKLTGATGLVVTVFIVLGLAVAGQILFGIFGRRLREQITIEPIRVVDQAGGAVLNVIALLIIGWILAATAAALPGSPVAVQVRGSALLASLDRVVPDPARALVANLRDLIDDSGLPQLFDSFGVLPPAPVEEPSIAVVKNPAVQQALHSVVKVYGNAPSCKSGFTGSGFVFAPGKVITNAHVVAGVLNPHVTAPDQGDLDARTVYFDPRVDVAVLDVPGLRAPALPMNGPVERGADAIIAGYPGGGDMTATAARVRGTIPADMAQGTDIYGNRGIEREIYALRGVARPGSSGGPLLSPEGRVDGVIFAQAQADPQTAYALTAAEVAPAIRIGRNATQAVDTGVCPR